MRSRHRVVVLAYDRLAENIYGEADSLLLQILERRDDFPLIVAEHELPGHPGDLRADAAAQQAAGEIRRK